MLAIEWLADGIGYAPGGVNCGVVWGEGDQAILIDTGLDDESGRKLRKQVQDLGRRVVAVINTHSHADHVGGNRFLTERAGVEVYAPAVERGFIEHPELEPFYLFGGAWAPPALHNKFLRAKASPVHHAVGHGRLRVAGADLELVDLSGHSIGQLGVAVGGVLFAADAFFGPDVVAKHRVPLYVHLDAARRSFDVLLARPEAWFVPGHGPATRREDLPGVLETIRAVWAATAAGILEICAEPREEGDIVAAACERTGAAPRDESLYYLMRATFVAHVADLAASGRLRAEIGGGRLRWVASGEPPAAPHVADASPPGPGSPR